MNSAPRQKDASPLSAHHEDWNAAHSRARCLFNSTTKTADGARNLFRFNVEFSVASSTSPPFRKGIAGPWSQALTPQQKLEVEAE